MAPPIKLAAAVAVTLQQQPVHISCVDPWCQAEQVIDAPADRVRGLITNTDNYPTLFPRVRSARRLDRDTVHIILKMPRPLSARDYVVTFSTATSGDLVFQPEVHPDAPPQADTVRLTEFAGRWSITPLDGGRRCSVRYVWHAELGGELPSWAKSRTRVTTGQEILTRLTAAATHP